MRSLVSVLVLALFGSGCTVLNDMSGYSGGTKVVDSGSPDTALADTSVPDTGTPMIDSETTDSTVEETSLDVGADADAKDAPDTATDGAADATDTSGDSIVTDAVTDGPLGCHLLINEVQTRSTATGFDEFIEIYNPCDTTLPLAGLKLAYRSATGATETVLIPSFAATATVATKGFFLIANGAGAFAATADATYSSGIGDDGGVALRDSAGTILDSVAWGAVAATHPFIEKAAAPQPSSGSSISREPAGTDTNDNSMDFKKTSPATPKA